ncbi:MAG: YCF48-related protein [Acidobacteriota bacterium]
MAKVRVVLVVLAAIFALSFSSRAWAQVKLLRDNTGWAFRVGLQWTNNDGEDWQTIAPHAPGWSMVNAFFLNTSNGWALLQKGRQALCCQFALASTDNHGLSWSVKPMKLPIWWSPNREVFGGGGTIDFVAPMHGWVDLQFEGSLAVNGGALFSTDDGGQTWRHVKKDPGVFGTVRFITPKEGWVGGGPGYELYGTHDGGKTWEKVNLPPPPGLGPTSTRNYYLPTFQGPGHGYLPVSFFHPATSSETFVLFQTVDGGKTWKPTMGVLQCPGCSGVVPLTVADSTLMVVEKTSDYRAVLVKATPDGRVEKASGSFGRGTSVALSFLTPQHGWLYDSGDVLVTTDGGETWTNPSPVRHGVGHRVLPRKPPQR